ncbi:hypothetical protein BpHYR1_025218 [Brachionus plicatilis]|uniref:Uncharacterized protein n=1 Tax=Brachionus plicatilis TaxID=10195 RepID=A0A3M7QKN5_BRAPC|nr:hypothetical protein BpHYR1_025218 [Brachionus plicatilis]
MNHDIQFLFNYFSCEAFKTKGEYSGDLMTEFYEKWQSNSERSGDWSLALEYCDFFYMNNRIARSKT